MMLITTPTPAPAADKPAKDAALAYEVFNNGYFVSNKFHPNDALTLVVFTDRKSFDEAFGIGRVMGKPPRLLPANAFEKNLVAAAMHRGKKFWSYEVIKVESNGKTAVIHYRTEERASDSASFACPLIVLLPRGEFTAVKWTENGKSIGEAAVPAKP